MKILYATHQFFPEGIYGTERFTFNVASSLQKAGHHVRVAAGAPTDKLFTDERDGLFTQEYIFKGIPVTVFKPSIISREVDLSITPNKQVSQLAENLIDKYGFDLIHVTHPLRVASYIFTACKRGIPYILTLTDHFMVCYRGILLTQNNEICFGPQGGNQCLKHCPIPDGDKHYFKKRIDWARQILSRAAFVAVPSQFVVNIFKQEFPEISIKVIPYGVNVRRISRNNKFYNPQSAVTFGFMGSIGSHKGVHLLIEAFMRLTAPQSRLKIHGAFYHPSYVKELKAQSAGDQRIEFCGAYSLEEDLNGILNSIDVLCVPSTCHDTHPFVLQEAKAAGVPAIGARRGGIPESIEDGVNGFIFDPANVKELHDIMAKIINDPPILNALKKQITLPPMVEEEAITYERIYREALRGQRQKVKRWWEILRSKR